MKKMVIALAAVAVLAAPAMARETMPYSGGPIPPAPANDRAADIVLEYDGDAWATYGTSPGWTDEEVTIFEIPAGGPYSICEVWFYIVGTSTKDVDWFDGGGLFDPPGALTSAGPSYASTEAGPFPPLDWTIVDVTGLGMTAASGDIVRPGTVFLGDGDGIGLAAYMDDGNPGHSWALFSGFWTDDTYAYGYDAGIRLGLCTGPTPTIETTWGQVKSLFE